MPLEKEFDALEIWSETFFLYFESFKSYGGSNVIIKVWIVKILSKFKPK